MNLRAIDVDVISFVDSNPCCNSQQILEHLGAGVTYNQLACSLRMLRDRNLLVGVPDTRKGREGGFAIYYYTKSAAETLCAKGTRSA